MTFFFKTAASIVVILFIVSCENIFPGEGKLQTQEYSFSCIKKLVIDDIFNVTIIPDTLTRVTITAGENQLETVSIEFDTISETLNLSNTVRMRMLQGYAPIEVKVHTSTLNEIAVTLASTVSFSDTLYADVFKFISNGDISNAKILINAHMVEIKNIDITGKIIIEGKAQKLAIINRGLSGIDGRNFKVKEIQCEQYSMGDCHLVADSALRWSIFRNGNIYQYKAIPVLHGQRWGSGQLFIIE
ncbi:MAG TPA: DUF2807 domain-containing protein [Salinivirgaceae bacterium]|nr:DUF2807 domain-containing protein [Salinivirgaceae bacterium]